MTTRKVEIPAKESFKIGEVARLLELEPYVLRFWETEFKQLAPRKTRTGQRAYSQEDVRLLIRISHLLYTEQYTIAGARRQLGLGAQDPLVEVAPADEALAARCEELGAQLEVAQAASLRHQEQLGQAQAQQTRYDALVAQLQQERAEFGAVAAEATARLEQTSAELERLRAQQAHAAEHGPAREELAHATAENERLATELGLAYQRVEDLCNERDALERHCDELNAKLRANTRTQGRVFAQLRREVLSLKQAAAN